MDNGSYRTSLGDVWTSKRRTNRPITRLYPLEITVTKDTTIPPPIKTFNEREKMKRLMLDAVLNTFATHIQLD